MPTISTGDKILVSGANGFIAIWVVRRFLEKGYTVRGTVRSADKGKYLEKYFKSYGDKFEIVVVEDITKEGAFDEAVKGVDAIAHTASPFYLTAASVNELIGPAVNGTVGILKSAVKNGQGVKRIVGDVLWYDAVLGEGQSEDLLKVQGSAYVDVRDVAEAHTLALEKEAAGGERIIIAAGSYVWQDWRKWTLTNHKEGCTADFLLVNEIVDAANSLSPSPIPSHPKLAVGYPGAGAVAKPPVAYDSSKAARILGLNFRTKEEITRDTLADIEERGW
ncbi:hypothetical protein H0H87_008871 [Tephrocybe sp. NHM501043]|nr:hypothetical protein H0H87_008871 [Tephrocybe sp. NHM501043]